MTIANKDIELDETYIGTKWEINPNKYPKDKGDTVIIVSILDGKIKYDYYPKGKNKLGLPGTLAESDFLSIFCFISKLDILENKINKIRASL